jgi:ABC-type amino acid transport substrate-binding protein
VPWEFQDASGQFVGFEVDLINEVAERLGKAAEIENIPFQDLFAAVQPGRIDMAVSSITITEKRLESVSFAQPCYDSDQSLTVAAVDRHEVGIRSGDFYARRLIDVLELAGRYGVVRVSMVDYNTLGEVDRLIGALEAALAG